MASSLFPTKESKQINQQPTTNNFNSNQIQTVMQLIKGRNPKEVFFEECNKRGIDPQTIINMIGR